MTIQVLDSKTVSQIAAGEVVERPASVVKELVENALDAGSRRITVETRGGGVSLIRVVDDGGGIPAAEAETAFERHATSKIRRLADLETVTSLGFRGEALPSIAAAAEIEVQTRVEVEDLGTYLSLKDGLVSERRAEGRSRGTTITVRNLFRKMPARLKFLKSAGTESSHIATIISQYALAFPEVRFALINEGRQVLGTPGTGNLIDAIVPVYGSEVARGMIDISQDGWQSNPAAVKVSGMVGTPEISRASRSYLSFFVNRRWVNSRLLAFAVEEAYQGLLMQGKHPVAVINLTIPPAELDVNIHPAKTEIKFSNEHAVFSAVQRAVRRALVKEMPVPKIEEVSPAYRGPSASLPPSRLFESAAPGALPVPSVFTVAAALPVLRVLGQLAQTYIIAEGGDGLYLIDQHAAHERVLFELIRDQHQHRRVEVQGLLEPVSFELTPRQGEMLCLHRKGLADFGFSIEPFGERAYLVRAVPAALAGGDWAEALRDFLDNPAGEGRNDWETDLLQSLACHGAVRAGQVLTHEEMRELMRKLEGAALPQTCPHGRPTMVHLTAVQIRREFGRT